MNIRYHYTLRDGVQLGSTTVKLNREEACLFTEALASFGEDASDECKRVRTELSTRLGDPKLRKITITIDRIVPLL